MRWNHGNDTAADRSRQTLIGIFQNHTEAHRALAALHEHAFVAEQESLAGGPAEPDVKGASARRAGNWFGELRQIYNEETPIASRSEGSYPATRFAEYDISPDEAQRMARDFGPDASIVVVKPTDRWDEAQSLLKKYGARIRGENTEVQASKAVSDPATSVPVHAAPLTSPVAAGVTPPALTPVGVTPSPASTYNRADFAPAISQSTDQASPSPVVNSAPFEPPPPAEPGNIQLFGEELRVHKEKITNADVRVRKESVTRMETVQVPVTREHLVVEHTDGSPMGREGEIRIPLSEERVRIDKETRLHEEYKAGKRQITENESVTEPIRKERLLIDQPGDDTTR